MLIIRTEEPRDWEPVDAIHRAAFGDGHGDVVVGLLDALRADDPTAVSLVGERDGTVVGHVLFSRCRLDAPRRLVDVVTLSPLAVAPAAQRCGVGGELVRHGLRELDARGVPLVFLEGDPRYYGRLGFSPAGGHGFRKPSLRIPDRAFQVARLSAHEPWMTGTFVYSDTFWRHDCVGLRADDA
ncbi:GNAT family N-acetyltransferase [Micromonospora okii]|uniref:GNAT family N-acetyltransferase n=1 Tax=Micromonospora okii TaxID=1182970 RepID=UPI001E59AA4F|nr:N-acetyltransferase [Micromonospora okii]